MKKTLIALAVAASAAVSGSAMAWTANGTGGSVDMGGTLNPVTKVTPWEAKVGAAVTGLDGQIEKGISKIEIPLTKTIPVLGIRTQSSIPFNGSTNGIDPQIDYNGVINTGNFSNNATTLTLDVLDADTSNKIGNLQASFSAGAVANYKTSGGTVSQFVVNAPHSGDAFFGGVPNSPSGVNASAVTSLLAELFSDIADNYNSQGIGSWSASWNINFDNPTSTYSGYYASGIKSGQNLRMTFDSPAQGNDSIVWKATLPVTVSYQ
ncbi:hypothetical protein KEP68_25130 [Escherichia coli]|nr:hypothetical protein [Escherichia coli]